MKKALIRLSIIPFTLIIMFLVVPNIIYWIFTGKDIYSVKLKNWEEAIFKK